MARVFLPHRDNPCAQKSEWNQRPPSDPRAQVQTADPLRAAVKQPGGGPGPWISVPPTRRTSVGCRLELRLGLLGSGRNRGPGQPRNPAEVASDVFSPVRADLFDHEPVRVGPLASVLPVAL